MPENKPKLDYERPQPVGFWQTTRGERADLLISISILFLVAGVVIAGYLIDGRGDSAGVVIQ